MLTRIGNGILILVCIVLLYLVIRQLGWDLTPPTLVNVNATTTAGAMTSAAPPTTPPATKIPALPTEAPTEPPTPTATPRPGLHLSAGMIRAWWAPGGQGLTIDRADIKHFVARCGALLQVDLWDSESTIWINRGSIPGHTEIVLDRLPVVNAPCSVEVSP